MRSGLFVMVMNKALLLPMVAFSGIFCHIWTKLLFNPLKLEEFMVA